MVTAERSRQSRLRRALVWLELVAFTLFVPGTVAYWLPHAIGLVDRVVPAEWTARRWLALGPLAIGFAVYAWCAWEFATRGRGIPAPIDHPKALVVSGLYRYVRNPMYLGVLLFLLGESLWFGSRDFLVYTLAWLAVVHVNVLVYEEPNLRRKFGTSYERYAEAVGRWIPGGVIRRWCVVRRMTRIEPPSPAAPRRPPDR